MLAVKTETVETIRNYTTKEPFIYQTNPQQMLTKIPDLFSKTARIFLLLLFYIYIFLNLERVVILLIY